MQLPRHLRARVISLSLGVRMREIIFAVIAAWVAALPAQAARAQARIDGLFDAGGQTIRLVCTGTGRPVVVVDAGMGTAPVEDPGWQGIAAKIAPVSRICLADRAGLGGSAPSRKSPRTSGDAAADLHAALTRAGVPGPYLLVGHSIGGLHAQVFASQYPDDVAGLVLVSSTHPDQMTTWLSLLPASAPGEEPPITETRTFLTVMMDDPSKNEERLDMRASSAQAKQLKTLGDKPVIVVTHSSKYRMVPGLSEPLAVALEAATQRMQKQFLSLSSNARQHIADKAGHGLPHEDPAFVVENILEGVEAVRRTSARP
jgi:pimeloyl-ACP methyl ester carboxylesterase